MDLLNVLISGMIQFDRSSRRLSPSTFPLSPLFFPIKYRIVDANFPSPLSFPLCLSIQTRNFFHTPPKLQSV